jgi:sugar phosphate isomerase/epimerase
MTQSMPFKTALHSVSYAGLWGQTRLALPDFLRKAHALGYRGVMLMAKRPHLSVLDHGPDECTALRRQLSDLGLEVVCLAGYTDFGLGAERPDIPTREMQVVYVRELARLARALGCSLVRIFTAYDDARTPPDQQWNNCVHLLRECSRQAGRFDVTLGVQNHHDTAVHHDSLFELLAEVAEPNCKAMFDAWAPALQGEDLAGAVRKMAPYIVHTTVADYVRRPRFRYQPALVNYTREPDAVRAVPMGEGFIDYAAFFAALEEIGYRGSVAYEMCSPLRGGGSEENLDRCARQFLGYMEALANQGR